MKKAKEKPHYVDNKKFLEAMIEYRGYEDFDLKLKKCGVNIKRKK